MLLAVSVTGVTVSVKFTWPSRYHVNVRGMVDWTSHIQVAGWPGNTEVSINPMTMPVGGKWKYTLVHVVCHTYFSY